MNNLHVLVASALIGISADLPARGTIGPREPAEPGTIIAPPATDPGIVIRTPGRIDPAETERPKKNIDPGIVVKPSADAAPGRKEKRLESGKPGVKQDDVRGTRDAR